MGLFEKYLFWRIGPSKGYKTKTSLELEVMSTKATLKDVFFALLPSNFSPSLSTMSPRQVINLLRNPGPMYLCPDLLFLGIVQINVPMTQLRVYVLKCLINSLLAGHGNTVPVLQFAINHEKCRTQMHEILRSSMGAYYAHNLEVKRGWIIVIEQKEIWII